MKKISIITVCYNSQLTISDTIESVLKQDYSNVEYIIVDGNSNDETINIVNSYGNKISKFICEPDNGIYDAMNKGIKVATGEIVGILNSDDIFASNKVVSMIAQSFTYGVDFVYADLTYFKSSDYSRIIRCFSSKNFKTWILRFGITIPHPTFYVRRELHNTLGLYDTGYRVAADFDMIARFFVNKLTFKRIPEVIVKMRLGGISTTGIFWIFHQNLEIIKACKSNGIYTNTFLLLFKIPYKILSYFGPKKNNL